MWQIRQMMTLAMLAVSAYTDIRERNIYIMPLLIPCTGAILITVISFFGIQGSEGYGMLLDYIVFPAAIGCFLITAIKSVGGYMGIGDGYLMAAVGMMIGVRYGLYVIICGLVAASVYSVTVLIRKRGGRKPEIPFAPFVMTGFIILLINEI